VKNKTGEWYTAVATANNFLKVPEIGGVIVNFHDITERKLAEEALRESESRFQRLAEATFEGVCVHEAGKIVDTNNYFAEFLGYEPSEVIGMSPLDFAAPESRELIMKNIASGNEEPIEAIGQKKDGTKFSVEIRGKILIHKGRETRVVALRDLSERKKNEQKLRESEERFKQFVEQSLLAIEIYDAEGNLMKVNNAWEKLWGAKGEDVIGKHNPLKNELYKMMGIMPLIERAFAGEAVKFPDMEFDPAKAGLPGKKRWIRAKVSHVRDSDGILRNIVLMSEDVTDKKEAKMALQESEEKYRQLVKYAPTGIVIFDIKRNKITDVNDFVCEFSGYSKEELLSMDPLDFLTNENKDLYQQRIEKINAGEKVTETTEYEVKRKDNEIRYALVNTKFSFDSEGKPQFITVIFHDITQRKEMEEKLRQSEQQYKDIFENAPDAMFIADIDTGKIMDANSAASKLLLKKREDIIGLHQSMLHTEHMKKFVENAFKEHFDQATEIDQTQPIESKIIRSDGVEVPVEVLAQQIIMQGKLVLQGIFRDITERVDAEKALKESEEKFRTLADESPNMIFINKKGKIVYVNKKCEEIMEYTRDEFYSPDFDFLSTIAPEYIDLVKDNYEKHFTSSGILNYDFGLITKSEKKIESIISSTIINYEGEKALLGIVTDITDRKIAEKALQESEEKYRDLVENINEVVYRVDNKGLLTYVSPSIKSFIEYTPDEVVGKDFIKFFHEEDIPQLMKNFQELLSGSSIDSEYRIFTKSGKIRWMHTSSRPIFNNNIVTGVQGIISDITERRKAEEVIRASEEKYRDLANLLPQTLFEIDLEGNFTFVNQYAYQFTGYTQEDIDNGLNAIQLFIPEDRERVLENISRILKGEKFDDHEYTLLRKDGNCFPVLVYSSPIMQDNKPVGLRGIVLDISHRKQAEDAIKESEEKYRLVSENIPVAVYSALPDEHSTNLFISGRMKELTGYSSEEFMNDLDLWLNLIIPEDRGNVWSSIEEHRKTKSPLNVEYRIKTKDNEIKWIGDQATPMLNENNEIERITGFMEDITIRKSAEEALRTSEEKFRTLFESAGEGILYLDAEGIIVDANPKTLEIAQIERKDVIGENIVDIIPLFGLDVDELLPIFEDLIDGGTLPKHEWEINYKDGNKSVLMAHPSLIKKDDKVIGMSVILDDITERKVAENKTIDERNRAELYLDILSHDINNLDQAIISSSELLLLKPDLNKDHERYVKNSLQQAKAISDLITNVRKLSDLKESEIRKNTIDVFDVIQNAMDRIHRTHPTRDIEINHNLSKSQVFVNGNQLLQDVFDNLLGNAIKYDRHDKAVVDISFSLLENEDYWKLEIMDRGPGIPDVMKEKIFKRLERGEESIHGSGLGLTIVREVIRQCEGKVWVEDRVEKDSTQGSNFVITLPKLDQ